MEKNLAEMKSMFWRFSEYIPIVGEDRGYYCDPLYAYTEDSDDCIVQTPDTETDRLMLQRALLSLMQDNLSCKPVSRGDNEVLFEENLELFNNLMEKAGIHYIDYGECNEMFPVSLGDNSETDDSEETGIVSSILNAVEFYLGFIPTDSAFLREAAECRMLYLPEVDNFFAYFIECDTYEAVDSKYRDQVSNFASDSHYNYTISPLSFGFTTVPIYGKWQDVYGFLLLSLWGMPQSWYQGKAPLCSADLCELGRLLLDFPRKSNNQN